MRVCKEVVGVTASSRNFHSFLFLHKSEQVGWDRYKDNLVAVSSDRSGSKKMALGL